MRKFRESWLHNEIVKVEGKEKFSYESSAVPVEMYNDIKAYAYDKVKQCLISPDKQVREGNIDNITDEIKEYFAQQYPDQSSAIGDCVYKLQKSVVRELILKEKKRVDGRGIDEIRALCAEVDLLPRTHGSGLFMRCQTQVLSIVTLGALGEVQMLDGVDLEEEKRYMHHYNFPPYSVGESRPS